MLQIFHRTSDTSPAKGNARSGGPEYLMVLLRTVILGSLCSCKEKWDGHSGGCQDLHLHQQRLSFGASLVRTCQAPGTVLHLPVAAGLQEENCRCACRQCERLRLHFKHLLSRAHKSQPWPKKELPACNFACLLLTIDIRHAGVHGRCDMTVQSLTVCPFCRCADQTSLVLTTGRVIDVAGSMAGLYCRLECIHCPQLCIIAMW